MTRKTTYLTFANVLDANGGIGPGFTTLRLIAASAVFLAHSPWLVSRQFDFTYDFSHGQTFIGSMAVGWFFVISGFLVTESLEKTRWVFGYVIKRCLRIFPGLIGVIAISVFIIGPIATSLNLAEYFSDSRVYSYLGNAIFLDRPYLPGVFDAHPVHRVNGSIWTLRYEMLCYLLPPVWLYLRPFGNRYVIMLIAILSTLPGYFAVGEDRVYLIKVLALSITPDMHLGVGPFLRLVPYFLTGMTFYYWKDRIPFDRRLAIFAAATCVAGMWFGFHDIAFPIAGGYLAIFLGLDKRLYVHWLRERDYSYGIYIYAFPIQQLMIDAFPRGSWWINAVASAPLILFCAALSWNCIEKPAIQLKHRLVGLRRAAPQPL
jgi:peptidoglycan/LPS O-acetylase OafA/YrhL